MREAHNYRSKRMARQAAAGVGRATQCYQRLDIRAGSMASQSRAYPTRGFLGWLEAQAKRPGWRLFEPAYADAIHCLFGTAGDRGKNLGRLQMYVCVRGELEPVGLEGGEGREEAGTLCLVQRCWNEMGPAVSGLS